VIRLPFWSDGFDMDLLKVLPEVEEWCGQDSRPLYVHAHATHGRLNSPCAWNAPEGLVSFFSLAPDCPAKPSHFYTSDPIVECTILEVLRDIWVHGCYAVLDGRLLWDSQGVQENFNSLMYHRRGWIAIPEYEVTRHLSRARSEIRQALSRYAFMVHRHKPELQVAGEPT